MGKRYPGLAALTGAVGGILIADLTRLSAYWFLCGALLLCTLAVVAWRRRHPATLSILLIVAIAGLSGFRYADSSYDLGPTAIDRNFTDYQKYRVFGKVVAWPELRSGNMEIVLRADSLVADRSAQVRGNLLVRLLDSTTAIQMGDRLEFVARLQRISRDATPDRGSFAARMFRKGIRAQCYLVSLHDARVSHRSEFTPLAIADRIRERIASLFAYTLPPRSAALASGFFLGETRNISADTYRLFRDSGTLHLLAVSGSNVALVLGVVALGLRPFRVPIQRRRLILLLVVGLFAYLTYLQPSVIRASVMAALVLGAGLFDRRHDLVQILFVAAFFILLWSPAQMYDVGFQLSFAGAFAMVFLVPRWLEPFAAKAKRWWYAIGVMPIIVSLAAFALTMPMIAVYFERVPWLTPVTNLLIVPLVAISTVGVALLLTAFLITPLLGQWIGSLLHLVLELIVWLLRQMDSSSSALTSTVPESPVFPTAVVLIGWFLVLVMVTLAIRRHNLVARSIISGLFAAALLLGYGIWSHTGRPGNYLRVAPVSGGQGLLVVRPDNSGDLILCDLQYNNSRFGGHRLKLLLSGTKVSRIDRMILHSVDHQLLPDIFAYAKEVKTGQLYLPASYAPAVHDRALVGQIDSLMLPLITWYEGVWKRLSARGLYLSENGVVVYDSASAVVAVSSLLDIHHLEVAPSRVTLCLAIYHRHSPDSKAPAPWPPAGQLVCNRLIDLDQPLETRPDSTRPLTIELYSHGPVELPLLAIP